jgi:hypothetical protein
LKKRCDRVSLKLSWIVFGRELTNSHERCLPTRLIGRYHGRRTKVHPASSKTTPFIGSQVNGERPFPCNIMCRPIQRCARTLLWLRLTVLRASPTCDSYKHCQSSFPLVSSGSHTSVTNVVGEQSGRLGGLRGRGPAPAF